MCELKIGCMNCGEEYEGELYVHPEYSGDRFCGPCLLGWWEEDYERYIDEMRDSIHATGLESDHLRSVTTSEDI